jgi:hypothetical protein
MLVAVSDEINTKKKSARKILVAQTLLRGPSSIRQIYSTYSHHYQGRTVSLECPVAAARNFKSGGTGSISDASHKLVDLIL